MGGGLAYHLAYRFHRDIAGVFALSSFVNQDSVVYEVLFFIFQFLLCLSVTITLFGLS